VTELPEDHAAAAARVWQRIANAVDELSVTISTACRTEVPAIAALDPAELLAGSRGFVVAIAQGCGANRAPSQAERDLAIAFGRRRAEQGIQLESVLHASRVLTRELHARLAAEATDLSLPAGAVLAMTSTWIVWLEQLSAGIARGVREAELERGRGHAYRAAEFLHTLLRGQIEPGDLHASALALGLDPDRAFHTLHVRAAAHATPIEPHKLRALVADAAGHGAVIGFAGGDIAGITLSAPHLPDTVHGGIGPPLPLAHAPESFELATQALDAACAFKRTGAHTVEDLALEVAITDNRIGGALERRCFEQLDVLGDRGAVLEETVRAFLVGGMRFEATAQTMHLHPNTLRHRLGRFEEITGLDLHRIQDIVAVWGALERRRISRIRRRPGTTPTG